MVFQYLFSLVEIGRTGHMMSMAGVADGAIDEHEDSFHGVTLLSHLVW
jgi:hypothetical protein